MIGDLAGTGRGGLSLTPTEWRMLTELVRNAGQVLTYEILLRRVWGDEYIDATEHVKKYVYRLRQKHRNVRKMGIGKALVAPMLCLS